MRLACDTGGTFTDLVVEHDDQIKLFKASTTPDDPVRGVLDAIQLAANHYGVTRRELLTGATRLHSRHDEGDQRDSHRRHR